MTSKGRLTDFNALCNFWCKKYIFDIIILLIDRNERKFRFISFGGAFVLICIKDKDFMKNIFFSWQSDLDSRTHRNYIEKCIKKSIRLINKSEDLHIYVEYDRDTLGLLGTPDISSSIFEKISKCVLFVADISNITSNEQKSIPNPNVLIELGFAINILGWDKIICFFDVNTGKIENLPFDIRQKRVLAYNPRVEGEEKKIVSILNENILALYSQGKLANPLNDYMKGKIDKCILDISIKLSNLLFQTVSLSDGLSDTNKLLNLSIDDIKYKLDNLSFPAFVFLDEHDDADSLLREILKELFASNYFRKEWAVTVLNIMDWLRVYRNIISQREYMKFVVDTGSETSDTYAVVSAYAINPSNPPNAKIVLEVIYNNDEDTKKYVDIDRGKVINTLEYPDKPKILEKIYIFNKEKTAYLTSHIFEFVDICKKWLDITDSEFVLDPDTYKIGRF